MEIFLIQTQSPAEPLRTKSLLLYKMRMFSCVLRLSFVGQLHSPSWDNTDFCVCQIDKQATTKGIILTTLMFESPRQFIVGCVYGKRKLVSQEYL